MPDAQDEIVELEQRIEALAERVAQCRKVSLLARAMIGVGGGLLILALLGASGRSPAVLVLGFGAFLGGVALLGTNRGTLGEIRDTVRRLEGRRAELIGAMRLRLVP